MVSHNKKAIINVEGHSYITTRSNLFLNVKGNDNYKIVLPQAAVKKQGCLVTSDYKKELTSSFLI